jgi:hypothetical protein
MVDESVRRVGLYKRRKEIKTERERSSWKE